MEISITERKFINYLKKWLIGNRNQFIKRDIKRKEEMNNYKVYIENDNEKYSNQEKFYSSINLSENNWYNIIENKKLYNYSKCLSKNQNHIVYKVIIENEPISIASKEINISKQLANYYKSTYLKAAKLLLLNK